MSDGISIGSVSVGLGDTPNPNSVQSFGGRGVDGVSGATNLFAAAMSGTSPVGGISLTSTYGSNFEAKDLLGPDVTVSVGSVNQSMTFSANAPSASFRPQASSFDTAKAEINQISENSHMNSPGVGMSFHEPTKTEGNVSSIFASLVA